MPWFLSHPTQQLVISSEPFLPQDRLPEWCIAQMCSWLLLCVALCSLSLHALILHCHADTVAFPVSPCFCVLSVADLYHVMIYMFLKPGTMDDSGRLFGSSDHEYQATLQLVLLGVALVAVPWMLVPKPMILKKRAEAAAKLVRQRG